MSTPRTRTAARSLGADCAYEHRGGVSYRAKDLRPLDIFRWHGFVFECERQARRTTFARAIDDALAGARIQIKHATAVALLEARDA